MTNPPGATPPLPENLPHVMRRIRRCESEDAAQAVLNVAVRAYAAPLIARVAELQADAERWRFSMRYQKRYEETPELRCEAMDEMWRKVIREHRRAPTVEEYEAATDAAIAALKAAKD